jgi:hypothetical protein
MQKDKSEIVIKEGQTKKGQKNKQQSTKHYTENKKIVERGVKGGGG